ncbi:gustatory receptor for sugar taste 43a-like [Chelonus insularis]|uniref:gustatory receptor for sugar taste 43a-like n=1 Tax=Chelonus insularis TaxID=460826 RepID=UPI00158F424E|nr:gustatory receptor for sugar taste 43a-like [Chelonus insularis]
MSKLTKSDIYQGLFPIYHLSKVSGLLPVRFVHQRNDRYIGRIHVIDIVLSIFLLVLFIVLEIWGLWRDLRDGWVNSTRLKHQTAVNITVGDVCAVALLATVGVLGAPFRWKYIQEMISRFVHADDKLGFINLKKTRRFAIILATATIICFIILASLDIYVWDAQTKAKRKMSDKGPINYTPVYFLYFQALMIEIQCTIATYNLNERFIRLNKNLENLLKSMKNTSRKDISLIGDPIIETDKIPVTILRPEMHSKSAKRVFRTPKKPEWTNERDAAEIADSLSQLISIHSSLCDINLLINKAFGFPILVVGITCLLHLIITPYFLMMEANNEREGIFIFVQCLWCILHIYRMLMVVQPCYATTKESKNTAVLISQLLTYSWQPDVRKQLEIFSLQLLHRPLNFSACGLFSLDRALVTSMAGAVTTYLVILIQFQKADDSKDNTNNMLKNATLLLRNVSSLHNTTGFRLS